MKRFKFLLFIAFCSILNFSNLFAKELSEKSEVSLLTCSPGEELYSLFGHSALRFKDPVNQIDLVFNYGTFNFNTPNFYMKFARGKLKYRLAYENFENFKVGYIYEKRGIIEQTLNLDLESKRRLFSAVLKNYQPENRYYSYDFLFDNCSTRIRDIIESSIEGEIIYNETNINPKSFWNLLDHYMENSRWIYLGIHLILGSTCDIEATPYEYMFLPDNMMYAFNNATINHTNQPLVDKSNIILATAIDYKMTVWYKRPGIIFGLIAFIVLIICLFTLNKKKNYFIIDHFLFAATGLLGWIIIFLWFFTDHQATGPNWNIIWALPIYFPIANFCLITKSTFSLYFFRGTAILLLVVLAFWSIIPQSLPMEILPFVALLFIRTLYIIKKLKINF